MTPEEAFDLADAQFGPDANPGEIADAAEVIEAPDVADLHDREEETHFARYGY